MSHTKTNKDQLLARVRRIAGQMAAIEKAIGRGGGLLGCAPPSGRRARRRCFGLMDELIEDHVREHVARPDLSEAKLVLEGAEELIAVIRRYAK